MQGYFRSFFKLRLLLNKIPLFYLILVLATILRLLGFPNIPPGLNQDEAANGYEAFSLLNSGADRWGNRWPVYFVGWGSGHNVLLAYLQIPFIATFGLNSFALRLPLVILGILTVILTYLLAKKIWNQKTALLSSLMLSVLPWHVMTSRWALESNVLPFTATLGLYTLVFALDFSNKEKLYWWQKIIVILSLFPFALSFYAYGLSILPIAIFIPIVAWIFRKQIYKHLRLWLASAIVMFISSLPFLLFIIKNNFLHRDFGFEKFLPFSINLLEANRLSQINDSFVMTLGSNAFFVVSGFPDFLVWNNDPSFLPLAFIAFPFSILGIYFIWQNYLKNRNLKIPYSSILLAWLLAFIPILFFVPVNANRTNSLFIPIIMISSFGILEIGKHIADQKLAKFVVWGSVSWLLIYALIFQGSYHILYNKIAVENFNNNYDTAILKAQEIAGNKEKIYLTKEVQINYVFPLLVYKVKPEDFRKDSKYEVIKGDYNVHYWQNFYFDKESLNLKTDESWLAIVKPCKTNWCDKYETLYRDEKCYKNQELWSSDVFTIYRCYPKN